jgi:hypothetical protein
MSVHASPNLPVRHSAGECGPLEYQDFVRHLALTKELAHIGRWPIFKRPYALLLLNWENNASNPVMKDLDEEGMSHVETGLAGRYPALVSSAVACVVGATSGRSGGGTGQD